MFGPLKANTGYKEYVQDELVFVLSKCKFMHKKTGKIYIPLLTD